MAEQEKLDLGDEKPKSSKKLIFIILGVVLVIAISVFATLYFMGIFPAKGKAGAAAHKKEVAEASHEEHEEEQKPVIYLPLPPPFVANFKNNPEARILQIEMAVASTDQSIIDTVKKHTPKIRNNLLLLLGGQDPAVLKTAEGKEALRKTIKEEITKVVLESSDKKSGVDEVFFTGFIMQ
jgi:flagellar protein FliL